MLAMSPSFRMAPCRYSENNPVKRALFGKVKSCASVGSVRQLDISEIACNVDPVSNTFSKAESEGAGVVVNADVSSIWLGCTARSFVVLVVT